MIPIDGDHRRPQLHAIRSVLVNLVLGIALSTASAASVHAGTTSADGANCGPNQSCAPTAPSPTTPSPTTPSPTGCTATQLALGTCTPSTGGGTCSPAPGGNPSCSTTASPGTTSGGSGGDVQVGGGNPINLVNGNKYQLETDLPPLPGVLGLELKRHYNSLSAHAGLMGAGWRMSYEVVLYDLGSQVQILQADGQRLTFQRVEAFKGSVGNASTTALCTASQPQDGQVRIERDARGQPSYVWRWPDGRTLTFSNGAHGGFPLQSIVAPGGERLDLTYAPSGELIQVRDPQGRRLSLAYSARGVLKSIDTPLGRLSYTIDARGRLIEVASSARNATTPDRSRLYHYEDAYDSGHIAALTGISLRSIDPTSHQPITQRLSTYAYDKQGLAILTTKGVPLQTKDGKPVEGTGIEQLQVAYTTKALPIEGRPDKNGEVQPRQLGRTVITNSLGATSTLTSAVIGGRYRLISYIGPGCSTCGPSNMRYAYNAAGQLLRAIHLGERGQPTSSDVYEYDAHGRAVREGIQAFAQAKPQPTVWKKRFEYADQRFRDGSIALAPQASLIAEPSVVAGKEHLLRFTHDDRWRVTKVTESGFSPIDDQGRPAPQGVPITRSTSYRYATIGSRSLLVEIDGPLANGPGNSPVDSDITHIDYDAQGNAIARLRAPGGLDTSLSYDAFGRLAEVRGAHGVVDRYEHDLLGHVLSRTRLQGGHVIERQNDRYDMLGNPVEHLAARGEDTPLQPQTAQGYDVAGRLLWQADRLGILRRAGYDGEDHLLSSEVTGAGIDQQERYTYDDRGRLAQVNDSTGAERRLLRDEDGRVTGTLDPLGRLTRYERHAEALAVVEAANTDKPLRVNLSRDAAGRLSQIESIASDGVRENRRVVTRLIKDDFGREVAVTGGDRPAVVEHYDEADRLLLVQDAQGHRTEMMYDVAGRLTRRVSSDTRPRVGGEPITTDYTYDHGRISEIRDPNGIEGYAYDGQGRVERITTTSMLATGGKVTSATRYRYDKQGQLIARSLPDGRELHYERNGQGQIVAVTRQTAAWAPFGWGRKVIVKDLERDLIGLRHMTYGNGVEGRWQRSREGVLARVVYTRPGPAGDVVRPAFENLLPSAHANDARSPAPGAFGLKSDPQAIWDSRLLFNRVGNVLINGQFARSDVVSPGQTGYAYDAHDQLTVATTANPAANATIPVVDAEPSRSATWRYHDDSLGNRLLAQQDQSGPDRTRPVHLAYSPDANRLVSTSDAQSNVDQYDWNPEGRSASVRRSDQVIAAYRYDHRGLRVGKQTGNATEHYLYNERRQRLAELDSEARLKREYVWLADQPVAVIDLQTPARPAEPTEGFLAAARQTWQAFSHSLTGGDDLAYVHANHLGAPIAMTDQAGKPIWRADYAPFGQRLDSSSPTGMIKTRAPGHVPQANTHGIRLDLRLPGQWEDAETGLHYNDQRYYDPERGRYISADPLGLRGGLNAYAYVGNNPVGYVDPLGLVLFAFDGTDNTNDTSWLNQNNSSFSNVWNFRTLYDDGVADYVTGVGTVDHSEFGNINPPAFDDGLNLTGPARIDRMIQYFDKEANSADDNDAMEVDIVGFSRGAAQARDFANQIVAQTKDEIYRYSVKGTDGKTTKRCQRVDFRFMGLFDTVLSTNQSRAYNLAIPDQFAYVAQATALNEYRSNSYHAGITSGSVGAFPLESIVQGSLSSAPPVGKTRIERGFVGSHTDIGGGFAQGQNQLAQVTLAWMVGQASAAGVNMKVAPSMIIANPVIHDKSDSISTGLPSATAEDRDIHYSDGATAKLRSVASSQGLSYADTLNYITFLPLGDPAIKSSFITGTVNMTKYLAWLDDADNGYGLNMRVQP